MIVMFHPLAYRSEYRRDRSGVPQRIQILNQNERARMVSRQQECGANTHRALKQLARDVGSTFPIRDRRHDCVTMTRDKLWPWLACFSLVSKANTYKTRRINRAFTKEVFLLHHYLSLRPACLRLARIQRVVVIPVKEMDTLDLYLCASQLNASREA